MFQTQNMQKQMKNVQSLHNWQFQSLKFHNLSKLVPEGFKWIKSQLKSLGNQKYSQMIPGWKFTQTGNFYPSSYKIGKNGHWYSKMENLQIIPLYYAWMTKWNNFDNILRNYKFNPLKIQIYRKGPWSLKNCRKGPWVFLNEKNK